MERKTGRLYEIDLYEPIKKYYVKQGYEVYGEVNDCDITAVKGDELIIIELKLHLNVELLVQATKRQRLTDQVYVAIPKPKYNLFSKKWRDICHLIKRLELGLIVVSIDKARPAMDIMIQPAPFSRVKSMQRYKRSRERIIREINGRSGDYNVGGASKTKIMTAYKESCIHIACYLDHLGPLTPKMLRGMGTGEKTSSILSKNYYDWFYRVKQGTYSISEKGKAALDEYPDLVDYYRQSITDRKKEVETQKSSLF
jgi:hypothetical protein